MYVRVRMINNFKILFQFFEVSHKSLVRFIFELSKGEDCNQPKSINTVA